MHACVHIRVSGYTDERIAPAAHTRPRAASVRARACVLAIGRPRIRRRHMRARSVGVDRGWLGSQAFQSASAFNANIGAWNTARVTTLFAVCAALSARAGRHRGRDALGGVFDAARAVVRGGGADVLARVCAQKRVVTRMRGCPRV